MVAGHRLGTVLEAAPGGFVALVKFLRCALRVGLVAQGEDRAAFNSTDEPGGYLIGCAGAAGDVAHCDDDLPGRRSRGPLRSAAKGEEYRQEGHDDYRCAPTGSEASERVPGFQGVREPRGVADCYDPDHAPEPKASTTFRESAYSPSCLERLSKKCGQPQNERVEAYETEQRGLISLRYDGDFCA